MIVTFCVRRIGRLLAQFYSCDLDSGCLSVSAIIFTSSPPALQHQAGFLCKTPRRSSKRIVCCVLPLKHHEQRTFVFMLASINVFPVEILMT